MLQAVRLQTAAEYRQAQAEAAGQPVHMLCADVDDTVIRTWDQVRVSPAALVTYLNEHNVIFMLDTGRHWDEMWPRMVSGEVPPADVVASDVGTVIHEKLELPPSLAAGLRLPEGVDFVQLTDVDFLPLPNEVDLLRLPDGSTVAYARDLEYDAFLRDSGFSKDLVLATAREVVAELGYDVTEQVTPSPMHAGLWIVDPTADLHQVQKLKERLEADIPFEVTWCLDKDYTTANPGKPPRFCVDVLPVGKDGSARYIAKKYGVDVTVVAGDSGNDIPLLENAGLVKLVVTDAKRELMTHVRGRFAGQGQDSASVPAIDREPATRRTGTRRLRSPLGVESTWYVGADAACAPTVTLAEAQVARAVAESRRGPNSVLHGLQVSEAVWLQPARPPRAGPTGSTR